MENQVLAATIPDLVMVDRDQLGMFNALGQQRSPFRGLANWPWLDITLTQRSTAVLQQYGTAAWHEAGGVNGADGRPTFDLRAEIVGGIVRRMERDPGGLLWLDRDGIGWAVKLSRLPGHDNDVRCGYAISWAGDPRLLDQDDRQRQCDQIEGQICQTDQPDRDAGRQRLQQIASRLRLYGRAEQLLWVIHASVLAQRRSVVRLPDVLLGQVIYGGDRDAWPQNWRSDTMAGLGSLTHLRAEILRLGTQGWQPRLGAHSVGVAHVEQLGLTRPQDDVCDASCPMFQDPRGHGHILVQIGLGFLGVLEQFTSGGSNTALREYDFGQRPAGERGDELKRLQKSGQTLSVDLPAKIFGPASWSDLLPGQLHIIDALSREVTRIRRSRRPDRAEVLRGNVVPGASAKTTTACPFLHPGGQYVTFGGNGSRRGQGYLLVGRNGRGWLHKCGYKVPTEPGKGEQAIRRFLTDLQVVAGILEITVAGYRPRNTIWLSLSEMIAAVGSRNGRVLLSSIHLRLYAAEDYLDRCRAYFERRGGFTNIPGGQGARLDVSGAPRPIDDVGIRMRLSGVTHRQMASWLGTSRAFVSQVVGGRKPWPAGLKEQAEAHLAVVESPVRGCAIVA